MCLLLHYTVIQGEKDLEKTSNVAFVERIYFQINDYFFMDYFSNLTAAIGAVLDLLKFYSDVRREKER